MPFTLKIMIKIHKNPFFLEHMLKMCNFMSFALPLVFGTVAYIRDGEAKYFALAYLLSVAVFQVM